MVVFISIYGRLNVEISLTMCVCVSYTHVQTHTQHSNIENACFLERKATVQPLIQQHHISESMHAFRISSQFTLGEYKELRRSKSHVLQGELQGSLVKHEKNKTSPECGGWKIYLLEMSKPNFILLQSVKQHRHTVDPHNWTVLLQCVFTCVFSLQLSGWILNYLLILPD